MTAADRKARRPMPRNQVMATVVLLLLGLLAAFLWFADPEHRPSGGSRINWPEPAATKP